jgi:tRNA-(ms[2]io[6]A)-hydroxylase
MAKKRIDLAVPTDPAWVNVILDNFDEFLCDHAGCERKAMAFAMSLVTKYPDRDAVIPALIEVAREELEHFQQVQALMARRGLRLTADIADPYVNGLISLCRHGRDVRFLDRLLVASLIETRGAERFRIIAQALEDPELRAFYRELWACEAKHGEVFVDMALNYWDSDTIYTRLEELARAEGELIGRLEWRPSLH